MTIKYDFQMPSQATLHDSFLASARSNRLARAIGSLERMPLFKNMKPSQRASNHSSPGLVVATEIRDDGQGIARFDSSSAAMKPETVERPMAQPEDDVPLITNVLDMAARQDDAHSVEKGLVAGANHRAGRKVHGPGQMQPEQVKRAPINQKPGQDRPMSTYL